jgi:hypothetical protein
MNGYKPEMSKPGFLYPVGFGVSIKPLQESMHLSADITSGECLKVDALLPARTGDELQWTAAVIAPSTHLIRLIPLRPVGNRTHAKRTAVPVPEAGSGCMHI